LNISSCLTAPFCMKLLAHFFKFSYFEWKLGKKNVPNDGTDSIYLTNLPTQKFNFLQRKAIHKSSHICNRWYLRNQIWTFNTAATWHKSIISHTCTEMSF
jgi:hypothetical protein